MDSSPTSANKLRQIEAWCVRINPEEQLTREQTEWLMREAATSAATVGAAETWLAIARHDAARGDGGNRPHCIGGRRTSDAEVALRATASPQLVTISDLTFAELCTLIQLPRAGAQAAPANAQAKHAAPAQTQTMACSKPAPSSQPAPARPSWWVSPKAPPPPNHHRRDGNRRSLQSRSRRQRWCMP